MNWFCHNPVSGKPVLVMVQAETMVRAVEMIKKEIGSFYGLPNHFNGDDLWAYLQKVVEESASFVVVFANGTTLRSKDNIHA
jgi:hypothetical protein